MRRFHGWAAVAWVVLAIATTAFALWAPDNKFLLAWVIFMSGYANAASHWGAKEAADSGVDDGTT